MSLTTAITSSVVGRRLAAASSTGTRRASKSRYAEAESQGADEHETRGGTAEADLGVIHAVGRGLHQRKGHKEGRQRVRPAARALYQALPSVQRLERERRNGKECGGWDEEEVRAHCPEGPKRINVGLDRLRCGERGIRIGTGRQRGRQPRPRVAASARPGRAAYCLARSRRQSAFVLGGTVGEPKAVSEAHAQLSLGGSRGRLISVGAGS